MEKFAADWLALREPCDAVSRARPLARAFLAALPRNARIADLGCGHGSNARYLASLGRRDLRWLLIDGDAALLSEARIRIAGAQTVCADLARRGALAAFRHCDGITASALCDLVSGAWIDRLVRAAARRRLPMLLALSVDGRVAFAPGDPGDAEILSAFSKDQRRGKGFGPALGAAAPHRIARSLRHQGYAVRMARSDWRLGPEDGAMLQAAAAGFAAVAPVPGAAWLRRRGDEIAAGRFFATVGHVDILAFPRQERRSGSSHGVTLP